MNKREPNRGGKYPLRLVLRLTPECGATMTKEEGTGSKEGQNETRVFRYCAPCLDALIDDFLQRGYEPV